MPKSKTRKEQKPLEKTLAAVHKALGQPGGMDALTDTEKRRVNLFTLRQQGKHRKFTREERKERERRAALLRGAASLDSLAARWVL